MTFLSTKSKALCYLVTASLSVSLFPPLTIHSSQKCSMSFGV
jgi:hypothetical protein